MNAAAQTVPSAHTFTAFGCGALEPAEVQLVAGSFNMLLAPDEDAADAAVAHFLAKSLHRGARVAVVAFDAPRLRLSGFRAHGFDFNDAMEDDRVAYIYYRPTLSRLLGHGCDYGAFVKELRRLTGPVERIAFYHPDVLFDLETDQGAADSVARFAAAAAKFGSTALGALVPDHSVAHARLRRAGERLFQNTFALQPEIAAGPGRGFSLRSVKTPNEGGCLQLHLTEGRGYQSRPVSPNA